MKKYLIPFLAIFFGTGVLIASGTSVFNSFQVGDNPTNGYFLKTNGTTSTWAVAGLGNGTVTTSSPFTVGNVVIAAGDGVIQTTSTLIPTVYVVNTLGNWQGTWQGVNSTTFITSIVTSTWFQVGNNLSESLNTSTLRSNIGYNAGLKIAAISSTGTIGLATSAISQWVNDSGYLTTSTGLTVSNFVSANISQWTNNSGYLTASTQASYATATVSALWTATQQFSLASTTQLISASSTLNGSTTFPGITANSFAYINGSNVLTSTSSPNLSTSTSVFGLNFSSSSLAPPVWQADWGGTIVKWQMTCVGSSSAEWDLWKLSTGIPTSSASSITGSDVPTMTNEKVSSSVALTGWTKTFAAGDYLLFNSSGTDTCNGGSVKIVYKKN